MNITNGRGEGAPKASVPMENEGKTGHGTEKFSQVLQRKAALLCNGRAHQHKQHQKVPLPRAFLEHKGREEKDIIRLKKM